MDDVCLDFAFATTGLEAACPVQPCPMLGEMALAGDPDLLRDVPASTYVMPLVVDEFRGFVLKLGLPVPSDARFFFREGCCSSLRNESSTMATFLLSRSVGSVKMPSVSKEPCRGGVMSRLGGLLRESDVDLPS